ncbi:MAG: copper resistance protein CopC [Gemmatimonadaceae bacterium]|nr:copper resistance protein CopC [Gemmatimonadaceae bacterium]
MVEHITLSSSLITPYMRLTASYITISTMTAALLFGGVTGFAPASVRYHAHLVKAEPAVNDTIATTPRSVRLLFSEPLELSLSRVTIVRVGGDTVKTGGLRHEGSEAATVSLDVTVPATMPGTYVVTYHVVARDGHPTKGSYNFVLRGAGAK